MTNPASIDDYRRLAEKKLPPAIWHYLESGAGADLSLRANQATFDQQELMPRPLANVRGGHTRFSLFGKSYEHPVLLAPVAYQRLFHVDGELASALAAEAQQAPMIVSSLSSMPLATLAQSGAALWFQLYWQGSRSATLQLLHKAEVAGCSAIVFTVDAPVKQASLTLPAGIRAVNLEESVQSPKLSAGQSEVFDHWMMQAPDWKDFIWLREQTRLPLLVKGLLHPEDAERALQAGCDGIVVSNHGGRVLDGAPASLQALPAICRQVAGRKPVLLDSGIRRGSDVYKALSLGADAVLLGRPAIWGLSVAGAMGVAHVIRLVRDELEMTMALCGKSDLPSLRYAQV